MIAVYEEKQKILLESKIIKFSDANLRSQLRPTGGVYRIFTNSHPDKTLYVGKTKNIKQRLYNNLLMGQIRSHTLKRKFIKEGKCNNQASAKLYLKNNCSLQYVGEDTDIERSFLEHYLIAVLRPYLND